MSTDGVDPINLIPKTSSDAVDPQPVDVIRGVGRRIDRCDARSDEKRVFVSMEPLSRPEVPEGRDPGPSRVWDEVVIAKDDFRGE